MTTNYERIKNIRIRTSNFFSRLKCKLGIHLWIYTCNISRYCVCCKRWQRYTSNSWQWLQAESEEE